MNLRRAVTRLLLLTAFLLLIAWVGMRLMMYRGDWEALINDLQKQINAARSFIDNTFMPIVRQAIAFFQEKWQAISGN